MADGVKAMDPAPNKLIFLSPGAWSTRAARFSDLGLFAYEQEVLGMEPTLKHSVYLFHVHFIFIA